MADVRWVTLAHIHLDRVAALWIVRRFVDPEAEFEYLEWGMDGNLPTRDLVDQVPDGAIPVGLPGVELGLHDAEGSCVAKVLRHYGLDDPALWRMERLVAAGVRHAFGKRATADETPEETAFGAVLDELGTAFSLTFDDAEHLERALPLYDALFTHCRLRELPPEAIAGAPAVPPLRTPYLRDALSDASRTLT